MADLQPVRGDAQPFGGERRQYQPCLGGGGTQRRAEHAGREGAEGAHVPRAAVGVAQHHVDGGEVDAEFLGHHLRLGRHDALAHLDLAGEDRDAAVPADHEVGVEVLRIEAPGLVRQQGRGVEADQHDDAAPEELQEGTAVEAR